MKKVFFMFIVLCMTIVYSINNISAANEKKINLLKQLSVSEFMMTTNLKILMEIIVTLIIVKMNTLV